MAGATPTDMLLASGLPAQPGSLWAILSLLAWADPELVRAHVVPLTAQINGATSFALPNAVPVDGVAVPAENTIVAHRYFLVGWIDGFVIADPGSVLEDTLPDYVNVQIEDDNRQYPYGRFAFNMGTFAPTRFRAGRALDFRDRPLTFLPNGNIVATFTPLAGFPDTVPHGLTQATTRTVGVNLHGLLVNAQMCENLLDSNREILNKFGILRRAK